MGKWTKIVFYVLILVLAFGCSSHTGEPVEPSTPEESVDKTDYKNRTIQIGNMHYPPYETVIDGQHSGPGIDTMKEVFNRMGYTYEIKEIKWETMIEMMKTGDLDVIVDAYVTPERSEFLDYSLVPYGVFPQALFAKKDSGIVFDGNLESLKDYSIGITRGYAYGPKLDPLIESNALKFEGSDDSKSVFRKLKNGRVDLVADTPFTGNALIEELGVKDKVVMLSPYFDNLYSYIAFSKANTLAPLRDEYDKTLGEVFEDGTLKKIFAKYTMDDIADSMIEEYHRIKSE